MIQTIETRPATEYTLEDLREMSGSEYLLAIQRNGQRVAIKIKVRSLV